jgi:hypothetical protein
MRNYNPFTKRQIDFIEALNNRITTINDPDPEIITHEFCRWQIEQTRQFGKIPKIKFHPHSCRIKAEIIRNAGLIDENRDHELSDIRQRHGIKEPRYSEARLFEAELNNIMLKLKKAVYAVGYINNLLTADNSQIAAPLALLQQIVMEEQAQFFNDKKQGKSTEDHKRA